MTSFCLPVLTVRIMPWLNDALEVLVRSDRWGYHTGSPSASEPAAFVAMALIANGHFRAANRPLQFLADMQQSDGHLGVFADQSTPGWPTSLAILAWSKADAGEQEPKFTEQIGRAVDWTLSVEGKPLDRQDDMGHDTTLIGWPWVDGTHSWMEPTAFAVMALKATDHGDHPRTREAARLIIDRLLPDGGCNYGNTLVLGQELRPHVQPSGIALAAIADEGNSGGRIGRTKDYLLQNLSHETTAASLSFAVLGLKAWGVNSMDLNGWLHSAAERTLRRDASPYKLALLALAATSVLCPLYLNR